MEANGCRRQDPLVKGGVATVLYMDFLRLLDKSGGGGVIGMIYSERRRYDLYQLLVSYTFIVHRASYSERVVTTPSMTGL